MTTRRSKAQRAAFLAAVVAMALAGGPQVEGALTGTGAATAVATTTTTVVTTTSPTSTSTTSSTTSSTSSSTTISTSTTTSTTTTTTTIAPPAGMVEAVQARLADPRFEGTTVGLSVWVDGSGEVFSTGADSPMRPGSNEKLLAAAGALAVIGPDTTLTTEVRVAAGAVDGPVVHGDLVLVGGGDPSLGMGGLDVLARQLRDRGIRQVEGDLVGDESRFDDRRTAPGWTERHMPTFVGPLSALAVGRNWLRTDPEYTASPALVNAGYFRQALQRAGISVTGTDRTGTAPAGDGGETLAAVASPPVSALVAEMLTRSDNFYAELLVKETGWRASGRGTTAAGLAAAHDAMAALGVTLTGRSADGSGLSRDNSRPAVEWRKLLVAAGNESWGIHLFAGLPIAGRTGTLEFRFRGKPGEGNVRAKTGSVRESRALSGYLTTTGGRTVTFSLIVNGATASAAIGAMDDLIATLAASRT